jgi:2-desacetyl-2-hydroxyethyl bacteriochlorophyllide A dehydrogenase
MATRIVFTGHRQVQLETGNAPDAGAGQVALRSHLSMMSTGTETIVYNRLFDEGSHWDKWVKYPFSPGYATIGEVTAVGENVEGFQVGDLVAARCSHASENVTNADRCFPIPTGMAPEAAAWFALAKIAFMGTRRAGYTIGDHVLIIGAGPIGQMATRWAYASGVETLIVVDRIGSRLKHARHGGATHTFDASIDECREQIQAACGGELPDIVMDTTGNANVFASALGVVKKFGRVVMLGDTGSPDSQHLTSDVVLRGVTLVGAHDTHVDAVWSASRIHRLFCNLHISGRFNLDGMTTHRFKPEDCKAAYDLATDHRDETMGILFDWR